jgi:hypothetical protein
MLKHLAIEINAIMLKIGAIVTITITDPPFDLRRVFIRTVAITVNETFAFTAAATAGQSTITIIVVESETREV